MPHLTCLVIILMSGEQYNYKAHHVILIFSIHLLLPFSQVHIFFSNTFNLCHSLNDRPSFTTIQDVNLQHYFGLALFLA